MKKDILQVIQDLLKHRTEDAGCYEFVLEAWIEEAAAEIERLRSGATCPHVRGTVTQHCSLNFTLTDGEREAVEAAVRIIDAHDDEMDGFPSGAAATLRKLLGRTNHDAVPEARAAEPESSVPLGSGAAPANTQTAPPCVETDDPPSKGEGLHISDSRTRLSEAEVDALEYVVEEGRIACMDDYGILRSLLVRLRPKWESESYEKGDEIRTNATTIRDTTPAVGSVQRDLIERLRRWVVATDAVPASDLMDEAADEIERLREAIRSLADQDATRSVRGGNVTGEMECQVLLQQNLTDEEREAIEWFAEVRKPLTRLTQSHSREKYKDTLCGLLERLK